MNRCPFCDAGWSQHSARCAGGVPAVDLHDSRGLAGRAISGYQIIGRIGEGGMGTVYLALDNITEHQLDALKVLNRDLVVDRERMRREAVTANRVRHPNVCRIYNYVETYDAEAGENLTLIAMELVRGPTLREVQGQSGGVLELNRAARVVREVANALQAVHAGGIIHRDIKPNNIIVTNEADGTERVKLVDFGIAKKEEGGEGQDLTEAGYVAATVHYASPEQLKGHAESRSDIYSLGVVFFELLTGRRPFEAANQAELYSLILDPSVSVPRLDRIRADLEFPRPLQAIIDRALSREPDKRYPTAAEFADAVDRLVPSLAETVVSPLTDFAVPVSVPTVPSQKAATTKRPGRRGGGVRQRFRLLTEGGPGLKVGTAVAAMAVAGLLFLGLGGGGALRRAFTGGGGGGADTLGEGTHTGSEVMFPGGEDSTEGQDLRLPSRIDLDRNDLALEPGEQILLGAVVLDASGNPLPDQEILWSSSRASVADVDDRGRVTGRSPGSATVTASAGTVRESADVLVRRRQPPPDSSGTPTPREEVCAQPASVLDPLLDDLMSIDLPATLEARLAVAQGCWGRTSLQERERAFAAYCIGMITWRMERIGGREEACSPGVRGWFERAAELGGDDPDRREMYDFALNGCRGDSP